MAEYQKSDYHALLFGAGFSAGFNLPVMRDFMRIARRRFYSYPDSQMSTIRGFYDQMFRFAMECGGTTQIFNRDWDNIEELYTQADLLRIIDPEKYGPVCDAISWAIWDVYRCAHTPSKQNIPPLEYGPSVFDVVSSIRHNEDLHPAIITTNYDVMCEVGIRLTSHSLHAPYQPFFYYPGFDRPADANFKRILSENSSVKPSPEKVHPDAAPETFPLIKLHGSVNWFRPKHNVEAEDAKWEATPISRFAGMMSKDFDIVDLSEKSAPAIIPPMLGKTSDSMAIRNQWKAAIEVLKNSRRLTIVGYSFPRTDAFMLRLLSEGLKQNTDLDRITIVDNRDFSQWRDLLIDHFTPVARNHKTLFVKAHAIDVIHYIEEFRQISKPGKYGNQNQFEAFQII